MATEKRPSLVETLEQRYASQRAGGAFDVKKTLKNPGNTPAAGTVIDAINIQGAQFQSPNGFEVKVPQGQTQLKDAQGTRSKQLSRYMIGFDGRKYKP